MGLGTTGCADRAGLVDVLAVTEPGRRVMIGFFSFPWNFTSAPENLPTTPSQKPWKRVSKLYCRSQDPQRLTK